MPRVKSWVSPFPQSWVSPFPVVTFQLAKITVESRVFAQVNVVRNALGMLHGSESHATGASHCGGRTVRYSHGMAH